MAALPTGTVTFLLTDVEGSTRLWDEHPEPMRGALVQHDAIVEFLTEQHGGAVVRPRGEGDSRFCVFARAGDYYGSAVNRCARLRAVAHGGQTLLSRATHDLVVDALPPGAVLRDLGEQRLKDLQRPESVFQLGQADLPGDFAPLRSLDALPNNLPLQLTSFVGRC